MPSRSPIRVRFVGVLAETVWDEEVCGADFGCACRGCWVSGAWVPGASCRVIALMEPLGLIELRGLTELIGLIELRGLMD